MVTFEERLKKAEEMGFTPVMIVGENICFFVASGEYQIGSVIYDSLGVEFRVNYIGRNGRMKAVRINRC